MENWVKDLRYVLMPTRGPVKGYEKEYYAAYAVWREAWEKFRSEIGVTSKLFSDGFMIPDEMGVLFYQGECVGFASFQHGTLDQGPTSDQSWFESWTPETMKALHKISNDVIVCSQFTISPKFAGKGHVVRWKEILSLYTLMRFEVSDAGVMAGHLNLSRGMHHVGGDDFAGTVLCNEHAFNFHGVDVPAMLVAYERHKIQKLKESKKLEGLCDDLWSRLVHLTDFSVEPKVIPLRKVA